MGQWALTLLNSIRFADDHCRVMPSIADSKPQTSTLRTRKVSSLVSRGFPKVSDLYEPPLKKSASSTKAKPSPPPPMPTRS